MLDYRVREAAAPRREDGGRSRPTAAVVLHGFGANSADLYPLADELDPEGRLSWYFPEAPYSIRYGGSPLGKAWFPRNEEQAVAAVEGMYFHGLEEMDPQGLRAAGAELIELLHSRGVAWERLILGGFSQGAMVAVEAAVQAGRPPADLLLFSGAAIAAERWQRELPKLGRFEFFQSHGTADAILPLEGARRLYSLLEEAGGEAEFLQFDGGHGIPPEITERAARRIERRLQ
jgi:phospholipase/carboxylesterase